MGLLKKQVKFKLVLIFLSLIFVNVSFAETKNQIASRIEQEKAVKAFDSRMYSYSMKSFEKALQLDRSNYEAMMYLAKVSYFLKDYTKAEKVASNLASSFYPSKKLKIEAFELLADIAKKQEKQWNALAYVYAASEISTAVDMSHLVNEQITRLNLASMSYPVFDVDSENIITSKNMKYVKGSFVDVSSEGRFEPVSFSVPLLKAKFVVVAGFDNRLRFNKLLVIKATKGVQPKIFEVAIQKRKRGGVMSAKDLYLKVMDWNFDD